MRPFGRDNDGDELFQTMRNPTAIDYSTNIQDGGLLTPMHAHSFTAVGAGARDANNEAELKARINANMARQSEASGYAIVDNTKGSGVAGSGEGSLDILEEGDNPYPTADGTNGGRGGNGGNGGTHCEKSDCILWAVAGVLAGFWLKRG